MCVCFQVGTGMIDEAIAAGAHSIEGIGAATCAGTNCGSCLPELRRMLSARSAETLPAMEPAE